MPKWMASGDAFMAPKAFGLAVLLGGLKPKNLILGAAAGTTIAQAGLSGEQGVALAVFVVLASLTIEMAFLRGHIERCLQKRGFRGAVVAVDFYQRTSVVDVAKELNDHDR